VLAGLPVHLVRRLQSVLNAAARLTYHLRRSDHITDALVPLHYMRLTKRLSSRLPFRNKVLHELMPQYLGPLNRVADLPGRRALRSSGTGRLALPVVGPRIWNDLPADVTSAESLSIHSAGGCKPIFFQNHSLAIPWTLNKLNLPGH